MMKNPMDSNDAAPDSAIADGDARAVIRLLGEATTLEGGHHEVKRFVMDGLCQLIGADCWIWTLACETIPGGHQAYTGYIHGGFDEERFAGLLKAVEHPDMGGAVRGFYEAIASDRSHTTMLPAEIDPDGVMQVSEGRFLWQDLDIGPIIISGYPLDPYSFSTIALYGKFQAPAFGERERRIVHTLLSAVPWLHELGWPQDRGATVPRLRPKERIVLNLLMEGWPRKAIADKLDVTEGTVAGYARELFRHFGVHSQPELIGRWLADI